MYSAMKSNIQTKLFTNQINPVSAYLLGFLWADSCICIQPKRYYIRLEIIESDGQYLLPLLSTTGHWTVSHRNRKNRKPQIRIEISHKDLRNYLLEHGYHPNDKNPDKILSTLNTNLVRYWLQGYIDGDGCWYYNVDNRCYQFSCSGPHNQDWKWLEKIFEYLSISHYKISLCESAKGHKHSVVRISNRPDCKKLFDFVYPDEKYLGLERKFDKAKFISAV